MKRFDRIKYLTIAGTVALLGLGVGLARYEQAQDRLQRPCISGEYWLSGGYEVRIKQIDYNCDGEIDRYEFTGMRAE